MDALPTILGVVLVAIVAGLALLPLLRGVPPPPATTTIADPAEVERFGLYRQVLELEFDQQTGKLAQEDFEAQTRELLDRAGEILRAEQADEAVLTDASASAARDVEAEVEREIAAARKAFAQARQSEGHTAEVAPS
jgi:hypothetical protein